MRNEAGPVILSHGRSERSIGDGAMAKVLLASVTMEASGRGTADG